MKKNVSFDFDQTLDRPVFQEYARDLINRGFDVHIVTSRFNKTPSTTYASQYSYNNEDLFEIAFNLYIPIRRIHFTSSSPKYKIIKIIDPIFHLDDDFLELDLINKHTNCKGISSWQTTFWKWKANKAIHISQDCYNLCKPTVKEINKIKWKSNYE